MPDLVLQSFSLLLLASGLSIGYWFFIRPRQSTLNMQQTGLLFLILFTVVGGFFGAPFWWLDQKLSFSWDLPPLASRMLAAAGWSFSVAGLLALLLPSFRRLRLLVWLLWVYLAPLAAVILLFHLDRFDWEAPITYAFFVIVIAMLAATGWYLVRPVKVLADEPVEERPLSSLENAWLSLLIAGTAGWGLCLFITDSGPFSLIWVWPGDLLTSRLIGVMLFTIAAGSTYSILHPSLAPVMLAFQLTYGLGVTSAGLWNLSIGKPVPLFYTFVFGLTFLISTTLLARRSFTRS
jgi:hypothetical protein